MSRACALVLIVLLWPVNSPAAEDTPPRRDPQAAEDYRRGTELGERGDHAGAIAAYAAALQRDPSWLDARNDLGVEYYLNGDPRRAAEELRAVLEHDATRGPVHTNLAFALYDLGQLDAAVTEWQKALDQGANVADTYAGLALGLFKQGKIQEAIRTYRVAIERDPHYAQLDYLESGSAGWSRHAIGDAAALVRAAQRTPSAPPAATPS